MVKVALQVLNSLNKEFSQKEKEGGDNCHLANGGEGADVVAGQVGQVVDHQLAKKIGLRFKKICHNFSYNWCCCLPARSLLSFSAARGG